MSSPNVNTPADHLPITQKQIAFARKLALQNQVVLPWDVQQDRKSLSLWIDAQVKISATRDNSRPTSKQVAFAERIARAKRRTVPDEYYRDREMLSRWITSNMH